MRIHFRNFLVYQDAFIDRAGALNAALEIAKIGMNSLRQTGLNLIFLLIGLLAIGFTQPTFAMPVQAEKSDDIAKLRQQLESANDLEADAKKQIQELLDAAEEFKKKTAENSAKLKTISELPDAEKLGEQLTQQLQLLKKESPGEISTQDIDSNDLDNRISSINEVVKKLKVQIVETDAEINRRATQRNTVRNRIAELDEQIAQTRKQLESLSQTDPSLLNQATRLALQERFASISREIELLQSETVRYELEEKYSLLQLNRELYDIRLKREAALLARHDEIKSERTKQAANSSAIEAKQQQSEVEKLYPALVPSYQINTTFAERNQAVAQRLSEINNELGTATKRQEAVQREYRDTKAMIDRIGLSGSVGALLRKSKSKLPNSQANLISAKKAKTEVDEVQFEIFEIDRQLASLSNDSVIKEVQTADKAQSPESLKALEMPIESLIQSRHDMLTSTRKNLSSLYKSLVDMEIAYRTVASVASEFRDYINERILWIRSNKVLLSELQVDETDLKAVSPSAWQDTATQFKSMIFRNPLLFGLIGFVISSLLILKRRLRNHITEMGQIAGRGSCDTFWPTVKTLFATVLVTIAIPSIFFGLGLAIQSSEFNDGISLFSALGFALFAVAWFLIPVEFLRRMCREDGLAQKHLAWSDDAVRILKHNLDWLNPIGGLITFGIALLQRLDLTHRVDLTERILFVAGMICLLIFLYRCVHPRHGIFHEYLNSHERSWARQTSAVWFSGILLVPITFGVLAVVGYYYTALYLLACAFSTFVFAVVAETSRALLLRFILVQRRHVHIESSKRKRQAERELREKERTTNEIASPATEASQRLEAAAVAEAFDEVDVDINASEANRLVTLGMWLVWGIGLISIWSDVVPALRALDKPIYPAALVSVDNTSSNPTVTSTSPNKSESDSSTAAANGMIPAASASNAANESNSGSDISRVTYRDVLIFLVIGVITIAVARSLPSTLEMIFLNHLPMDRSVRFAIKTLTSYGIVFLGVLLAFDALQIGWSSVQWVATALTFGLAFGLQEIFANFVAGIILMFERPMRIGDWITIGDYSGTVSRIRTRATTLVSLERKEFVIPNKDFITGRLVNWTLSDAINRVDVNVGIAYGANVAKAKEILLEICNAHPQVVQDPPTTIIFQAFGDSSLNLVARAFVKDIECRMSVIDELHTKINDAFIEAGIVISFPQRDLHIRTASPELGDALLGSSPATRNNQAAINPVRPRNDASKI